MKDVPIKFHLNFESNDYIAHQIGRFALGPIENNFIVRYLLTPNGQLIFVLNEEAREYVKFFKNPEGLLGL